MPRQGQRYCSWRWRWPFLRFVMRGGDVGLEVSELRVEQGAFRLTADFSLAQGARVAVLGSSGGGKSTLLGAIGGFLPVASGNVQLQGKDVTNSPPDARGCATLFQDSNLFPHLTLAQNVGLGLRPSLRLGSEDQARVMSALARVGLSSQANKRPGAVSGGQQSRAALARVLLMDREWLLLDEPFAALDPALRGGC